MILATDQGAYPDGLSATSKQVLAMRDAVIVEWEQRVRRDVAGAQNLLHPVLINTIPAFYDNIAQALTPDYPRANATSNTDIATAHGNERSRMTSYGPAQIIHEYQLLREAFARVAAERDVLLTRTEWAVVHRSIDCAVRESIQEFTSMHDLFRQRVAAALSHDMRNPLSVVFSAAQLLCINPTAEKTPGIARRILDSGKRLSLMIDELLDTMSFHRGEKLPLELSRFDMRALAVRVCAEAESSVGGAAPVRVEGDAVLGHWCENSLRRALENLLTNAAKYGDGAGITVRVAEAHGRMMLSVHNAGRAIPEEQRERIFHYLWREGGKDDPGGWGIGLPFVQNVAESHGGSVAVDSSPETGTTFLIDIPVDCRPFADGDGRQAVAG